MKSATHTSAQINSEFIARSSPRPTFEAPEPAKYNIRIGDSLQARLYGSIQVEANDNINLSETDPIEDISIAPSVRMGWVWTPDPDHTMQFNLSAGYRWYLNSPSVSSVSIDPSSRFDHQIIIGDVKFIIYDSFSVQTDPLTRGEISGSPGRLLNFRRIRNTAGIMANWQPVKDWTFSAGYDYTIDRTLSGDFDFLDRDEHTFYGGAYRVLSIRHSAGIQGSYSMIEYCEPIQNDGIRYSFGPVWRAQLTKVINMTLGMSYTVAKFDDNGTIDDSSSYEGLSVDGSIRHNMNKRMSHYLQGSRSVGTGVGSNFTEFLSLQYGLSTQMSSSILLNTTFGYENLKTSGPSSERADRFLFYVGTTLQLSRQWSAGLGYAFGLKESDRPGRDYMQNRLTIDLARLF